MPMRSAIDAWLSGRRVADVRALQRALAAASFPVEADAVFGASTDAAVRAYQAKTGLTSDGMVGPATRARLGLG
jgi:N-acetylmuramoyl-L-alanine amidase